MDPGSGDGTQDITHLNVYTFNIVIVIYTNLIPIHSGNYPPNCSLFALMFTKAYSPAKLGAQIARQPLQKILRYQAQAASQLNIKTGV